MLGALSPAPPASSRQRPSLTNHGVRMDSLHAICFYVSAALAGVGGLGLAFARRHQRRALGLGLGGLGTAGAYLSLSAGFAAVIALPCFAPFALLIAPAAYRSVEPATNSVW